MSRPVHLPEEVARFAEAEVAAGNFASVEDVLEAGIEVLQQREQDWHDYAQDLWAERSAAADRGEFAEGSAAEVLQRVRSRVERAR